jgi:hypothetical protein
VTRRDAWARLTPYEVGIPGREFARTTFEAIREEAEARGVDPSDPGAFLLLGEVGRAIREIQGEERGGDVLHRFGAFLFHAFHFHEAGELVLLAETEVVRRLVEEEAEEGDWSGALPGDAGYLQLPRHLVWAHPDPEGPAEDLDGILWARSADDTLSLMPAFGIRTDRPGLSIVPLPTVSLADAADWPGARARVEGTDFETTLPGGELDRLYSVVTAGEVLKLVSRAFAFVHAAPECLGATESAPRPDEVRDLPRGTRPSFLPFRRIRAVGEAGEPVGEAGTGGGPAEGGAG